MLLSEKSRHRVKEFRGPEPGSVAILARNPGTGAGDRVIRELMKEREYRQAVEEQVKYQKTCYLRGKWETEMDQRMQQGSIRNRLQTYKRQEETTLEVRRDRLRDLIIAEEKMYSEEFENQQETTLERQARLRERARKLKEEKAQHNEEIAKTKYEQLWRDQCEELRAKVSKKHCQEIAKERFEQIREKEEQNILKQEEENYFLQLWNEDMKKKEEREYRDAAAQKARDREMADILNYQRQAIKARAEEEKKFKFEEAKLLDDLAALMKIEAQQAAEERQRKQAETRDLLESNIRAKMRRRAREVQEELAFEMALLSELEEMARQEASQEAQRKMEIRTEDRRYRDYLKKVKEIEEENEREMNRLCDIEIEKQWNRRVEQWRKERETRKALLRDVIECRRQQINERLQENERRRAEAQQEKERLLVEIERNRQLDEEEREVRRRKNVEFGDELIQQIRYNELLQEQQSLEKRREEEVMKAEEERYQRRLHETLDSDWAHPKLHPMRANHFKARRG